MQISDIKRVVEQVSRDKGISREVLIKALEEALKSAARKKFGNKMDIEVHYSEELGEIEVFQFKDVAETVTEPALQISLEEGRKLDPECEIGDSLGTKMETSTFGRIAAQSAKQVIIQKIKDAEKDAVYSSFVDRKGEIINGIVQRIDRGDIIVNLGQTEGVLPLREQVPKESYRRGDRIRALILDVLHETRGPQVILSRTHPDFLVNLFKMEVPEISEGVVKVMGAAREPGVRAKISVASSSADIDPVGACVGMKGSRVQNVVQELRGEKIDIISWHVDPAKFVCNALAPAEISRVIIDEEDRTMEVIVPDEFLSIAIGKRGQNVRLASKLTSWHLDVKSESKYSEAMRSGYNSLMALPGVGVSLADALYEKGFFSAEEISRATIEDLVQIRDIGEHTATKLIAAAQEAMLEEDEENKTDDLAPVETADATEAVPAAETAGEADTANPNEPEGESKDEEA
jgi:N utilization substance protein A